MHINKKEKMSLKGVLSVRARNVRTGEVVRNYTIRNVITDKAEEVLIDLLLLISQPSNALAQIRVGTDATAPTREDPGLYAPVGGESSALPGPGEYGGNIDISAKIPSYVTGSFEVQATFSELSEFVGSVAEAGLFAANDKMFARQVHPAIPKDGTIAIDYSWTISFTA